MLALMLMMSFMSACNKSGGGSETSAPASTTIESAQSSSGSDTSAPAITRVEPGQSSSGIPDVTVDSGDRGVTPAPVVVPKPISTLPALALSFMTNIELLNFSSTQEDKYNQAIEIVKLVVGTEEFRTRILGHTWNGSKQFADNGGKTNSQVYQSILDAAEKLRPEKNNTLDLEVELYYANNSVVGYTNPSVTQIWVNTKFFSGFEPNEVAGNLFHEWLHKLGYGHDSTATAKRPYSIPYAVGYIIRDIGKKFL